ncbi:TraR/DksA family transcriptional regulator [Nitrospina watsonii]|uniref:Transcriptional regulator, TraR/DksA family n=1 Tax=Nitrospina watsonii TaxID=1323948 RepID=A0ABN8W400_9BACT|nr:TraR/DksA C4-type zinc finger protein [Nitrospina watsonii]CAI2719535.1 Transcriptional regulator, TraR/DksA family [Nitrospina watsonii]
MNKKKISELKTQLTQIRSEILGDLEKNIKSSQDEEFTQLVSDVSDDAARSFSRQMLLNLGEQERQKLKLVEEALEKITSGEYGVCALCEAAIPEARLQVVPFTQYCVKCLEKLEQDEKLNKRMDSFGDEPSPLG